MCGIIGFNFISNSEKIFSVAAYRGPDNTAKLEVDGVTLGHNRLSIVDHDENSNQPFVSVDGRYSIVFNGEVYNYQELREGLKSKYRFRTASDTEVVLNSYIEYGEKCLELFRGMFAFAIYDKDERKFFCARDRIGIKPFVYYFKNGKFIFASEIKVILEAIGSKPEVNQEAVRQFLRYLYIPYPNTIFEGIAKLPPAHSLIYKDGRIEISRYWDVEDYRGLQKDLSEEKILATLDDLLDESVKLTMIADVELGLFLSGGLDSSIILYYMQKNSNKKINTFTLGFEGASRYDEISDAKIMADYFHTNHREIVIKPDVAKLLPRMVRHFDEPFASPTSLLIHELTKEAKKFATVALAGDGGDEVFGGYPKYKAVLLASRMRRIPKSLFRFLAIFTNKIPENSSGNHLPRRIKTFINSLSKMEDERYDDWSGYIEDAELNKLFQNDRPYKHIVRDLWNSHQYDDGILKSSITDLKTYLPNDMLYYGDTMSMANSFEVRFPLLDHKIIEFMTSIDSKWRIKDGQTKYLMKRILNGNVPDRILKKPKLGLNPPMGIWLKKDLKMFIADYLSKESVKRRGLLKYEYIQQIINEFETNKRDRSLNIWALIVLEEWFRQYVD